MSEMQFYVILLINSATLIEGTVSSLIQDEHGNITGVYYKDKQANRTKVCNLYFDSTLRFTHVLNVHVKIFSYKH